MSEFDEARRTAWGGLRSFKGGIITHDFAMEKIDACGTRCASGWRRRWAMGEARKRLTGLEPGWTSVRDGSLARELVDWNEVMAAADDMVREETEVLREQIGAGLTEHSRQAMNDIAAEQQADNERLREALEALFYNEAPPKAGECEDGCLWCRAKALLYETRAALEEKYDS